MELIETPQEEETVTTGVANSSLSLQAPMTGILKDTMSLNQNLIVPYLAGTVRLPPGKRGDRKPVILRKEYLG